MYANGIPSDKYKDSWRSGKLEQFPVSTYVLNENVLNEDEWWFAFEQSLEDQKQNLESVMDILLKEDLSNSPCWKRFAVVILKMDISGKYAGFAPTLKERKMREEAMAAFSVDQKERQKAVEEAKMIEKRIQREKEKSNKG